MLVHDQSKRSATIIIVLCYDFRVDLVLLALVMSTQPALSVFTRWILKVKVFLSRSLSLSPSDLSSLRLAMRLAGEPNKALTEDYILQIKNTFRLPLKQPESTYN